MKTCWLVALLLTVGCATPRVVQLDTGRGRPIAYTPSSPAPVEIDEEAFRQAVVQLVLDTRLDVAFGTSGRHVLLASAGGVMEGAGSSLSARLCEGLDAQEACLGLLGRGAASGVMGRRMMALSFAFDTVWEGVADVIQDLMDPAALRRMVTATVGSALVMLVMPEPITKIVALVLTASLIAYLGAGPVWNLGRGFLRLMEESEAARSPEELKEVGHRFGRVLGSNGARVLVIVAMTTMGGKNALASQGPRMPGFAQAAVRAEAEGGFQLARVFSGEVRSLAMPAAGVLNVTLAPTAVAAVAMGIQGDPDDGDVHHICTDKNEVSDASGGPWTPRYEDFFEQAGMSLNDAANKVRIKGHKGPHPKEYHLSVLDRIEKAMAGCQSAGQCRAALTDELAKIANDLMTTGTKLRKLITKNPEA
ncbi:AHH domain-containing protein [Corallococcus sp. bb12-1]|uniref:AHH domain-containing protein n=1 Tax=Corallococcus sp. bb12-1 TaxID=2996784 RepID=UPI00227051B2|nr:AHH domain-containing protein [Corallococcus sp. bb12-1]MCY1040793.1 AHH domain-containing protein [Corallococcus sp. bb12-1]